MSCRNYFSKREYWTHCCSHLSSYRMEHNNASGELCRVQSRAYHISPGCTSVQFFKDKYIPRGNQKYWLSVVCVRNSFRTCFLYSDITFTVHYRVTINSHWSNQFIWRAFPIRTLQKYIFNEVVVTHQSEFECINISVDYFRTRSIRKGGATFVATGCTLSQRMASICLHEDCKLGGVK